MTKVAPQLRSLASAVRACFAPLPLVIDTLDSVEETHRPLYVAKDGKFTLDVTGGEDTGALKRALEAEREEKKKAGDRARKAEEQARAAADRIKDVDPDRYRTIMRQIDEDEEVRLMLDGNKDAAFKKQRERLEAEHKVQMEKVVAENEKEKKINGAYRGKVLDNEVRAAASKAGIHQHAVDDALYRARAEGFAVDDSGVLVRLGKDGKPLSGKEAGPLTLTDWFEGQKKSAPHWFPVQSSGGGANGEGGGGGAGGSDDVKEVKRSDWTKMDAAKRSEIARDTKKYKVVDG